MEVHVATPGTHNYMKLGNDESANEAHSVREMATGHRLIHDSGREAPDLSLGSNQFKVCCYVSTAFKHLGKWMRRPLTTLPARPMLINL